MGFIDAFAVVRKSPQVQPSPREGGMLFPKTAKEIFTALSRKRDAIVGSISERRVKIEAVLNADTKAGVTFDRVIAFAVSQNLFHLDHIALTPTAREVLMQANAIVTEQALVHCIELALEHFDVERFGEMGETLKLSFADIEFVFEPHNPKAFEPKHEVGIARQAGLGTAMRGPSEHSIADIIGS